ncbi:Cu_bind_like domain-containing protein, partial [Cephalotus follicularis]
MGFKRIIGSLLVILMGFLCSSQAYKFCVGGRDGWVLNPHESYNHWAERNRFQVNDTLFFKYKKGSDSALVVTKDDYNSCNTKNPILSLEDGDSIFKFGRSGFFFFISGNGDNCNKGQKLIILVMAVRNKPQHPIPSPSPPSPPSGSPSPESPPKVQPPVASPDSGKVPSHSHTPAPAPSGSGSVGLGFSFGLLVISLVLGSFVGV